LTTIFGAVVVQWHGGKRGLPLLFYHASNFSSPIFEKCFVCLVTYRKCYLKNFKTEVLGALARLRPACERYNSREEDYCQGRLPLRGIEKAMFWSLMAEIVSLLTYLAGVTLRRMDLARCPISFRRL
jgi:hypothetical protein